MSHGSDLRALNISIRVLQRICTKLQACTVHNTCLTLRKRGGHAGTKLHCFAGATADSAGEAGGGARASGA